MKNTVLIAVKNTDDDLVSAGIPDAKTRDYSLALSLAEKLKDENISVRLSNTDNTASGSDAALIQDFSILIVVALSLEHMNAAKKTADIFQKITSRRIIYLYIESSDMFRPSNLLPHFSESSQLEEYGLIGEKTLETFVKYIRMSFQKNPTQQTELATLRKLKRALPLSEDLSSVTKREWLDSVLDQWITGSSRKRICWLTGEHGSGKTVFIGDYCTRLRAGKKSGILGGGIYRCNSTDDRTQNVERIIQVIAYELCQRVDGYCETIQDVVADEKFSDLSPENMIRELLLEPFKENPDLVPEADRGRFVIVIDGIDELRTMKHDALPEFLNLLKYLNNLNHFIRIIITSAPDKDIDNTMTAMHVKRIDLSSEYHEKQQQDAERFLRNELDDRNIEYTLEDIQKILNQAEWNFDYLQHFIAQCDDDDNGKLPPLDQLPKGLLAKYESDFSEMFVQQYYQEKVKPIFQILAVAYEPLTVSDLVQILNMERNEITSIISGRVLQFLKYTKKNGDSVVSIYKASLESWLSQRNHAFNIDADAGKAKIVEWIRKDCSNECRCKSFYRNNYLQKYGLRHLLESGNFGTIKELIEYSTPDDFEKLKAMLGMLVIREDTGRLGWKDSMLQILDECYDHKVRDILVYVYRYVLKRRGPGNSVLYLIAQLLHNRQEEIRAELLFGEGIENYYKAKQHFTATMALAEKITKQEKINAWWDIRMLGVTCNRLANLENKYNHHDQAQKLYEEGKVHFEQAKRQFEGESEEMQEKYKEDILIIDRDLGISNERLGDISFGAGEYESAATFYLAFYRSCEIAYMNQPSLRTKWDLSISLLRLGDTLYRQGKTGEAQMRYRRALELRRDILQYMRSDYMDTLPRPFYVEFICPEETEIHDAASLEMIKESRDIDPIRDIAMCYARLGDLAFSLDQRKVAQDYYDAFVRLCEKNNMEVRTKASEHDLEISKLRKARLIS